MAGTARARASHARPRSLLAAVLTGSLLTAALATLAACGYRQDVPTLPGGANALHLQRVTNLTDTGELDVRLRAEMERRFSQQAHLRLTASERSALALGVVLYNFKIDRSLDPAINAERTFFYSLSGAMTLTDQRTGRKLIDGASIHVEVFRLYAPSVRETPAIRDEGLNDVLARFAEEVEKRLIRTF